MSGRPLFTIATALLVLAGDRSFELSGALLPLLVPILLLGLHGTAPGRARFVSTAVLIVGFASILLAYIDNDFRAGLIAFGVSFGLAVLVAFRWNPGLGAMVPSVNDDTASVDARVSALETELRERETRYDQLFSVSHLAFSEQDFSAATPVFEKMRAQGVRNFRTYMDAHPDELSACVHAVRVTRVNDALAHMLGYETLAQLTERPPVQNAETAFEILTDQLEMVFYGRPHLEGRTILIGKDERRIPIYYTVNRLSDTLQITSNLDLTDFERVNELRLEAQEELARANRIATMGALSASITHELNQPIVSMVLDTKNGLRWLDHDPPNADGAKRALERLSRTAERAAAIIKATRDRIARGRHGQSVIDIRALLEETVTLLAREIALRQTLVERCVAPDVKAVYGDRVGLQQVIVNLLTNAMDAMSTQPPETRRIGIVVEQRPGELVNIQVTDSGPGINNDLREKIFEPFFTTKEGGVGLGLQICRSTIESFGSSLKVRNGEVGGAIFDFTLSSVQPDTSDEPTGFSQTAA